MIGSAFRFKDDKELRATPQKHIAKYADGKVELGVRNVEKLDAGVYLMRATNELGSVECKAKIIVEVRRMVVTLFRFFRS